MMTDEPVQRPVTYDSVGVNVDPVLSRYERLAEIGQALGIPGTVDGIDIPPPCLVSMALLECIDSPFVCPAAEGEDPREVTRKHVLEALYVLTFPETASGPIDQATRARAAVQSAEARCAKSPELWEIYLEAMGTTARQAFAAFDAAVWAWAKDLPPVDIERLTEALVVVIEMGSRGYAMVPQDKGDGSKKKTTSANTASSGWLFMLWPWVARLAARCMRRCTRCR